ncbi:hypothetical protein RirG_023520 [Rhizophagus irregularis DAOM 197198w]|uniref:Uncharacterized protein n=1 Tax=Rhizophagus irregularis (strain DAOM 197198w) TaxID=1432141 RepID=A0A015KD05_RHIIW|nr:hypothetical protein RirG_023520 [Rhizophagus irregularis DAOM 197198w]
MSLSITTPVSKASIAPADALQPTPSPRGCQITSTSVMRKIEIANSMSGLRSHLATGNPAYRTTFHRSKAALIFAKPRAVRLERCLEHFHCPLRQLGMNAVIDPLTLTAILQQTADAELSQVARDLRLAIVERPNQFANA